MKTIDVCSNYLHQHNWREIDYDNILYISVKNVVCLTLCQSCAIRFLDVKQTPSIINEYKHKVDIILVSDKMPILATNKTVFDWFDKTR